MSQFQFKDALRCLLHTIIFNRALGPLRPCERDCETMRLSYACCGLDGVDEQIERAIDFFSKRMRPCGPDLYRGTLELSFSEQRRKSSFLGFSTKQTLVKWEQWRIRVRVDKTPRAVGSTPEAEAERKRRDAQAEQALRERMKQVVELVLKGGPIVLPPMPVASRTSPSGGSSNSGNSGGGLGGSGSGGGGAAGSRSSSTSSASGAAGAAAGGGGGGGGGGGSSAIVWPFKLEVVEEGAASDNLGKGWVDVFRAGPPAVS